MGAGAFTSIGAGAFAGAGEEPALGVPAPGGSIALLDDESVLRLVSCEITAEGAEDFAGAANGVPRTEVLLPLLQPASSTITPLTTITQPWWNPMLAPTRQPVSRCATVMLLRSLHSG